MILGACKRHIYENYIDLFMQMIPPTHRIVEMLCTCSADDCKNHRRIIMQGALRILLRSSEAISTANTVIDRLGESCQQKNSLRPKIYNILWNAASQKKCWGYQTFTSMFGMQTVNQRHIPKGRFITFTFVLHKILA